MKVVSDEVELSGCARLIFKTDQENSIRALMKAVKNERSENIDISPELSLVGESQSNGSIERAIRTIQAQSRTMKMAIESRYKKKIGKTHHILPFLIK